MVRDVRDLRSGLAIHSQVYDKRKHAPDDYQVIQPPSHFVLLEGVYLLQEQQIRQVSDERVYVEVDPEIRLARRVRKDVETFEMSLREVLDYYFHNVRPAFEKWVNRYKPAASFSVSLGAKDNDALELDMDPTIEEIMNFLKVEQR